MGEGACLNTGYRSVSVVSLSDCHERDEAGVVVYTRECARGWKV